ncbi:MAG: ABC transporter permease [Spirochaetales bacterium]|nr:ABC transporter permease [Spirochaetales bacterium]
MKTVTLAIRNVFRNSRRSVLTMAGIVAGIFAILITGGYYEYNYWGLRESLIRSQYAHIQITVKGYWTRKEHAPFEFMLPDWERMMKLVDGLPGVEAVSPHLDYFAVLETGKGPSGLVMVRGVIPERENQVNTFFTRKLGKDLLSRDRGQAEIGFELAEKLGVVVDSTCYLSTVAAGGMQNAVPIRVKGIIGSYSKDFDSRIVRIDLETAQLLADTRGIQELIVLLKDTGTTAEAKSRLQAALSEGGWDAAVSSWDEHAGYYGQVVQFYGGYFRVILFIVIVVAFFSTLNTMIMSVFERTGEVGTLRSFGASRRHILLQFVYEGLAIGLGGTIAGVSLSLAGAGIIKLLGGIPMTPPPGITSAVAVQIMISGENVLIASCIGIAVPLIAALLPAAQTIRTEIIEQLRTKR